MDSDFENPGALLQAEVNARLWLLFQARAELKKHCKGTDFLLKR